MLGPHSPRRPLSARGRWSATARAVVAFLLGSAAVAGHPVGAVAAVGRAVADQVRVPLPAASVALTLVGASAEGVAAAQGVLPPYGNGAFLTGRVGGELTRSEVSGLWEGPGSPVALGVVDRTLAWYTATSQAGHQVVAARRTDLVTGAVVGQSLPAAPQAYDGDWYYDTPTNVVDLPSAWRYALARARAETGECDELIPNVPGVGAGPLAADGTAVVRAAQLFGGNAGEHATLDLVSLPDRTVHHLGEISGTVTGIGLSGPWVVWAARTDDGTLTVARMPRTGGTVQTYTESDPHADLAHLAAGPAGVGYLVPASRGTVLRVVDGSTARGVDLPLGASGLVAVGAEYMTAVGGPPGTSGVYAVTGQNVRRVATVPGVPGRVSVLAMSGGQLAFTDDADASASGLVVRQRTVPAHGPVQVSPERIKARTASAFALSGARLVVRDPTGTGRWLLLDRGRRTGTVAGPDTQPRISGPYVLIAGSVYRPDGRLLWRGPGEAHRLPDGAADVFGPRVVLALGRPDGTTQILLDDVDRPHPTRLASVPAGCSGIQVALWADRVAWTSCNPGPRILVRDLRTGVTRSVLSGDHLPGRLMLGEGVLVWTTAGAFGGQEEHLLDLRSARSTPMPLAGIALATVLDGNRIAHVLGAPAGAGGADSLTLSVVPLPITVALPPRVLGSSVAARFASHAGVWRPAFDLTAPLRSATLRIRDAGGRTVATLRGSAPDGAVRDLAWDGRNTRGVRVPHGRYRWTLTGTGEDDGSPLLGLDGSRSVTGTLTF